MFLHFTFSSNEGKILIFTNTLYLMAIYRLPLHLATRGRAKKQYLIFIIIVPTIAVVTSFFISSSTGGGIITANPVLEVILRYLIVLVIVFIVTISLTIHDGRKNDKYLKSAAARRSQPPVMGRTFLTEKEKQNELDLFRVFSDLGASSCKKMSGYLIGHEFEFPFDHEFDFIDKVKVMVTKAGTIKFDIVLKVDYSLVFHIRKRRNSIESQRTGSSAPSSLEDLYSISNQTNDVVNRVLSTELIQSLLIDFSDTLEHFILNEKFYTVQVRDFQTIFVVFDIIQEFHSQIRSIGYMTSKVDVIKCFNCETVLSSQDTVCPQCSIPRSTCVICRSPVNPEEKRTVVETPCCNVYAHKEHILTWLKSKHSCPICHKNLDYWARKLQKQLEHN